MVVSLVFVPAAGTRTYFVVSICCDTMFSNGMVLLVLFCNLFCFRFGVLRCLFLYVDVIVLSFFW